MASFEIESVPELKLIQVTVHGDVDLASICAIATQVRQISNRGHFNVLCDMRDAIPTMSAMELSQLPACIAELGMAEAKTVKAVIIANYDHGLGKWQFLEYVQQAIGLHTAVFTHVSEALNWLAHGDENI